MSDTLHAKIMNLGVDPRPDLFLVRLGPGAQHVAAYNLGHRDARHAAAELALQADAVRDELVKALGAAQSALLSYHYGNASKTLAKDIADNCAAVIKRAT